MPPHKSSKLLSGRRRILMVKLKTIVPKQLQWDFRVVAGNASLAFLSHEFNVFIGRARPFGCP